MQYSRNQVLEIVKNNENFQEIKGYDRLIGVSKKINKYTRAKGKREQIHFYFFWNDDITLDEWRKARVEMNDWANKNNVELSGDFTKPYEVRHLFGRIKLFWRDWSRQNIDEIFYKLSDIF